MATVFDAIRIAIHERRQLAFDYRGFHRVAEPMALGIGQKGRWQIRAQQVGGSSSSGTVGPGVPKLFDVTLMSSPEILPVTFTVPLAYEPNDKAFVHIDTELSDSTNASRLV
jgi:hypothetical protein